MLVTDLREAHCPSSDRLQRTAEAGYGVRASAHTSSVYQDKMTPLTFAHTPAVRRLRRAEKGRARQQDTGAGLAWVPRQGDILTSADWPSASQLPRLREEAQVQRRNLSTPRC